MIKTSKRVSLPGFEGLPLYDVMYFLIKQTNQIGINERVASISFNFLMAVPPLGIFIFTLLSNLPDALELYRQALLLAKDISPNQSVYQLIKSVMDDFFHPGAELLSFGLILAIYFSSNAMLTIMRTFNKSMLHIQNEKRNYIQLRWVAIKLTLLIVGLYIAVLLVLVTQGTVLEYIRIFLQIGDASYIWILQLVRFIITSLLVFFSIALIYRYAPAIEKKWKLNSPGALIASALIISFIYLFSFWVNNFATYNKVYGSLGSILIVMLLIYTNFLVLLLGFELNVSINSLKAIARKRKLAEEEEHNNIV
ncbi:MAG: YihY/virulence factor BrkB family protein [Chitinophagaceae bacterium]|nr:YihY/virulence factor BrkB family protein [Chitinophagaceae bacterium]